MRAPCGHVLSEERQPAELKVNEAKTSEAQNHATIIIILKIIIMMIRAIITPALI